MVRPPRTLPESLSATMKMELDRLDDTGVSIEVDEPTDWINKMSVVKKIAGDVRICIDLRPLNLALKREHFELPVLDDILPRLGNSTRFAVYVTSSKDISIANSMMSQACCQRLQHHLVCSHWQRFPFGLKANSEIFQKRLQQALEGLVNVHCLADDMIINGTDEADLHAKLLILIQRCDEHGIRLNNQKCQFDVQEIIFLGHVVTADET